ncbi:non-ribosomal peptide synthetase, partial [Kitasatospora sp. MBT63]|uniref:non-ribosomal peptide synthetase n=1 Tax=Kitasatospora sp. MBT63 TaxID=1444768 RepID=UPI0011EA62C8
ELVRRGVGREAVVGLLVGRTPAGVAGLWGVLKAGAAYLPLDPQQPDARIAQLLRESGAAGCVTERRLLGRVPRGFAPDLVLTLDDVPGLPGPADAPGSAQGPDPLAGVRLPEPEPDGLAYVIHTSGSTGRPKGVQIEHRSLLAFVRWAGGLCGVDGRTRFAFLSSLSFDISCFPLFVPLLAGGAAVLVPGEPTGPALREALELHRADTFAVTPTHLDLFERYGLDLSGLRTLLVGGERFTRAAAVRAARRAGPATRIINGYGPTEAAVGCLAHVLDGTETGPVIPIGRPAPSVRVELAGPDGEPVTAPGAGTVGEILLSGVQLARGYLGRPDLTAAGFPVGADGVRRYRTGDLGRLLPDGSLEFAGRCDEQVKIAGHRVEPAEVQAALTGHPAVLAAAVTVRERPGGGSPALCAYVLAADGRVDDPGLGAELRGHLAERLPAHLVPATVVPVADFPRTVSGKTDLAALPDPWAASGAAPAAGPVPGPVAEADEVEQRVAALWADVLGVDRALIDRRSGFQQLGGDSLAVLEMLSAVGDGLLRPGEADRLLDGIGDSLGELTLGQVVAAVHRARSLRARSVRTGEVVA